MTHSTQTAPAQSSDWGRGHRIAFYTVVGLSLVSMLITGPVLTLPVTAWLSESTLEALFGMEGLDIHRVHMQGAALLFWLTVIAMVAQFRKLEDKAAPLWAAAAGWAVFLPLELTHLIDPYTIVVTVLVIAALVLHPRRWPTAPLEWETRSSLLAVPFAGAASIYAIQQAMQQLNAVPGEPHAVASHYELMTGLAIALAVSGLLGSTNFPGHVLSAWIAGVLTLVFAAFTLGYPNQTSSVGTAWALALVVWSVAYTLAAGRPSRRQQ